MNGLIIQWVIGFSAVGSPRTVSFPTSFTTSNYSVSYCVSQNTDHRGCYIYDKGLGSMTARSFATDSGADVTVSLDFIMIGY